MNRTLAPVKEYKLFGVMAPGSVFLIRFGSPDIVCQVFMRYKHRS